MSLGTKLTEIQLCFLDTFLKYFIYVTILTFYRVNNLSERKIQWVH